MILLVSAATIVLAPAAAAGTTGSDLLREMNAARAEHGLPALVSDPTLRRAAHAHAADMLRTNVFGHYGFLSRMKRFKVRGPFVGENLAWGVGETSTAAGIVAGWLASPTHRANLLAPRFRRVGLGMVIGTFSGHDGATVVAANFSGR